MFLAHLIAREALSQVRSGRFRVGSALAVALAVLTVAIRVDDYRARQDDAERQTHGVDVARQGKPGHLMGTGIEPQLRAVRSPSPGSVLVRGLDGIVPPDWDFSPWGLVEGLPTPTAAQGYDIGAVFDLEGIVRILLGLLAIVAGVEAVASVRSSGTLAALLSHPVSRLTVAAGTLLGIQAALWLCIGVVTLAILGLLWLTASGVSVSSLAAPVAFFAIASGAFLATMTSIGLAIGSLARTRARGVSLAMTAWVIACLATPQLVSFGPRTFVPLEPRASLQSRLQATHKTMDQHRAQSLGDEFPRWFSDPEAMKNDPPPARLRPIMDRNWRRDTAEMRTYMDAAEAAWTRASLTRNRWTEWLGRSNPATAFLQAAMAAADTGPGLRDRWQDAARAYQQHLNAVLFDAPWRTSLEVPLVGGRVYVTYPFNLHATMLADVGEFESPQATWAQRAYRARWDLVAVAAFLLGSTVLAIAVFPRPGF